MIISILLVLLGSLLASWWLARHTAHVLGYGWVFLISFLPSLFMGIAIATIINALGSYSIIYGPGNIVPAYLAFYIPLTSVAGILLGVYQTRRAFNSQAQDSASSRNAVQKAISVKQFALTLNIFIIIFIISFWMIFIKVSSSVN